MKMVLYAIKTDNLQLLKEMAGCCRIDKEDLLNLILELPSKNLIAILLPFIDNPHTIYEATRQESLHRMNGRVTHFMQALSICKKTNIGDLQQKIMTDAIVYLAISGSENDSSDEDKLENLLFDNNENSKMGTIIADALLLLSKLQTDKPLITLLNGLTQYNMQFKNMVNTIAELAKNRKILCIKKILFYTNHGNIMSKAIDILEKNNEINGLLILKHCLTQTKPTLVPELCDKINNAILKLQPDTPKTTNHAMFWSQNDLQTRGFAQTDSEFSQSIGRSNASELRGLNSVKTVGLENDFRLEHFPNARIQNFER